MMPSLPTDNVFKFWTIASILICVLIISSYFYGLLDVQSEAFKYRYEVQEFLARYSNLLDSYGSKSKTMYDKLPEYERNILTNKMSESLFPSNDRALFAKSIDSFDELLVSMIHDEKESADKIETAKDLRIKLRRCTASVENLWYLQDKLNFVWDGTKYYYWLGCFSAVIGFAFWFFLSQRLSDKLLKLQIANEEKKLKQKSP
jgi:hypothetical protein